MDAVSLSLSLSLSQTCMQMQANVQTIFAFTTWKQRLLLSRVSDGVPSELQTRRSRRVLDVYLESIKMDTQLGGFLIFTTHTETE
jgi:hypothetical protein